MSAPPDNERRATEDLLAGFDRPGRSPRAPAVRNAIDFQAQAGPATETVLVTRRQQRAMWPWLAVAFLASAGIGIAGFVVLARTNDGAPSIEREKHAVTTPVEPVVPASVVVLAPPAAAASAAAPHAAAPSVKKPEPHRDDFAHEL